MSKVSKKIDTAKKTVSFSDLTRALEQCSSYEGLDFAISVYDKDGKRRYSNQAFNQINSSFRTSAENGSDHNSLMESPFIREWLERKTKSNGDTLNCLAYSEGKVTGFKINSLNLMSSDNGLLGTQVSIRPDFSLMENRIRDLEKEKKVSDRINRVLLQEAPFAMIVLDESHKILQVNRAAEKLLGLDASKAVGNYCTKFLPCNARSCHISKDGGCQCSGEKSECRVLANQEGVESHEITGFSVSGEEIPLLRSVSVIESDHSKIIIEAFVDISEIKKAENEIIKLSAFNNLLVESTDDGIFSVDENLKCTFANGSAAQILGYKAEELIGQDIHIIFHGDFEEQSCKRIVIQQCIKNNVSFKVDDVFWSKDGSVIPVQYQCNPIVENNKVTGAVVVYRNVSEAKAMAGKMDYLSSHDILTGLPNRRVFEDRINKILNAVDNNHSSHVLCYIDLDQFKVINDTCGHSAGDDLLRQVSHVMQERIRKSDLFSRLGGDEFGLLLEYCHLPDAMKIIEDLLVIIGNHSFVWDNKKFSIGASIGVVHIFPGFPSDGNVLGYADTACFIAKEQGRNRIHVYEQDDINIANRHKEMEWVSGIKEALKKDSFELWVQPIVLAKDLSSSQSHLEVLLRMVGDSGKLIPPGVFIPAAERFGLMPEIDKWVVKNALTFLKNNKDVFNNLEFFCINLSGPSITDAKFLDFLIDQFVEHKEIVGNLCFEITETEAVKDLARAGQFMRRLKSYGCSFALDDFGSGMSSFAYLKSLPVDFLKIDGNFVRDMVTDKVDYAMVEAIHRVGHVIGIKTVAEFVENDDILKCLRNIGVDFAQGYGICRPVPIKTLLKPTIEKPGSTWYESLKETQF